MFNLSFSDGLALVGIVIGVILVILDKAGKLKGPMLFWLLGFAALMMLPLALGNSWVIKSPNDTTRIFRIAFLVCIVVSGYAFLASWISANTELPETAAKARPDAPWRDPKTDTIASVPAIVIEPEGSIAISRDGMFHVALSNVGSVNIFRTRVYYDVYCVIGRPDISLEASFVRTLPVVSSDAELSAGQKRTIILDPKPYAKWITKRMEKPDGRMVVARLRLKYRRVSDGKPFELTNNYAMIGLGRMVDLSGFPNIESVIDIGKVERLLSHLD